jgi:capsular exopolysaccharide synthesis family protein
MDLVEHFRIIGHNWARILIVSLLVGGGVYAWTNHKSKTYESSSQMSVTAAANGVNGISSKDDTLFLAATYANLATTQPVLARAIVNSKLPISIGDAASRCSSSASTDVGFLSITCDGPTPTEASRLTNAVAKSLITQVSNDQADALNQLLKPIDDEITATRASLASSPSDQGLQDRLNQLIGNEVAARTQPQNRVQVLSSATPDSTPTAPKPLRDALLAFLVALIVVAELSVGLRVWGDRFSASDDPEAIARFTGLPLLATIPKGSEREVVEAFRTLRTTLMVLPGANAIRSVAIVSGNPNAGKSFVSINLARSAAALDTQVILIDADLRRPSLHERLHVPRQPGLTDVLRGATDVESTLYIAGTEPRFQLLPSGGHISDAAGALGGHAFGSLVDSLADRRSFVVVDTPPGNLFVDAVNVASQCDATVFVLDVKTSRRRTARRAIESFQRSNANVLGIVVNRVSTRQEAYYEYQNA